MLPPRKTRFGYRWLIVMLAVALLAAACSSKSAAIDDASEVQTSTEPAATEPTAAPTEPAATEPATTEPTTDPTEPAATEPATTEPTTDPTEPAATEPATTEPTAAPTEPAAAVDSADTADAGDTAASASDDLAVRTEVALRAAWSDNVSVSVDGANLTFTSDGLPSHEYLDLYLGDGRDGKFIAGGVESYNAQHTFPLVPTEGASPSATPNGAIGVAVSGAVFFNPYEGDGSGTVANDDNSVIDGVPFIDACGGHPLPNGLVYHYHGIPFCITDALDTPGTHSVLIGYLFDGYPIYGPQDANGEAPTDLDECHGHVGMTPEFDEPVYHYHTTETANYIPECFHGVATTQRRGR